MTHERPIRLKRPSTTSISDALQCIVHYDHCRDSEVRPLSDSSFRLRKCVEVRQQQTVAGYRLDDICKSVPLVFIDSLHGAHRWCYKNFTNVSRISSKSLPAVAQPQCLTERRSSSRAPVCRSHATLFAQDKCIFCERLVRKQRGTKEFLITCVTVDAETRIKECALQKADYRLLGLIQGEDLRAREARYHESCRRDYVRQDSRAHHSASQTVDDDDDVGEDQANTRAAHADCFRDLCEYVQTDVIEAGYVARMSMLRTRYLTYMQDRHPDTFNPNYTSQKIKAKLTSHFGQALQFCLPRAKAS